MSASVQKMKTNKNRNILTNTHLHWDIVAVQCHRITDAGRDCLATFMHECKMKLGKLARTEKKDRNCQAATAASFKFSFHLLICYCLSPLMSTTDCNYLEETTYSHQDFLGRGDTTVHTSREREREEKTFTVLNKNCKKKTGEIKHSTLHFYWRAGTTSKITYYEKEIPLIFKRKKHFEKWKRKKKKRRKAQYIKHKFSSLPVHTKQWSVTKIWRWGTHTLPHACIQAQRYEHALTHTHTRTHTHNTHTHTLSVDNIRHTWSLEQQHPYHWRAKGKVRARRDHTSSTTLTGFNRTINNMNTVCKWGKTGRTPSYKVRQHPSCDESKLEMVLHQKKEEILNY